MTVGDDSLRSAVELYEIEAEIRGNHQINSLRNKLQRYGFIKEERYFWGVDEWNRPRQERAFFLVLVKKPRERAFKIMVTQTVNNSPLKVVLRKLTNYF